MSSRKRKVSQEEEEAEEEEEEVITTTTTTGSAVAGVTALPPPSKFGNLFNADCAPHSRCVCGGCRSFLLKDMPRFGVFVASRYGSALKWFHPECLFKSYVTAKDNRGKCKFCHAKLVKGEKKLVVGDGEKGFAHLACAYDALPQEHPQYECLMNALEKHGSSGGTDYVLK